MAIEGIGGPFLDNGGAVWNLKHPRWGVKGDGVTNDTAGLVAAFDYVRANGGCLFIPNGTYLCDVATNGIPKLRLGSNMTVRFESHEAIIKRSSEPGSSGEQSRLIGILDESETVYENIVLEGGTITSDADNTNGNGYSQAHDVFIFGGVVTTEIDSADSGWVTDDAVNVTVTHDTGDKQEGTASAKAAIGAGFATGAVMHVDMAAAVNLGDQSVIVFSMKSSVGAASGDFLVQLLDSAGLVVLTRQIKALTAATWMTVTLPLTDHANDIDQIRIQRVTNLGAQDVWVDDFKTKVPTIRNVTLRDMNVHNSWGAGVRATAVKGFKVLGGKYNYNRRGNIEFGGNVDDVLVDGISAFSDPVVTGHDGGIRLEPGVNQFARKIRFINNAARVISITGDAGVYAHDAVIEGNQCDGTMVFTYVNGGNIANNLVQADRQAYPILISRCRNVRVTGNDARAQFDGAAERACIMFAGLAGLAYTMEDFQVIGNRCTNQATTTINANMLGIGTLVGVTRLKISNNIIRGDVHTAIRIGVDTDVTVTDNEAIGTNYGIRVTGAVNGCTIRGNRAEGATLDIRTESATATNLDIEGNVGTVSITSGATFRTAQLVGSATWNPGSIADGAIASTTVTVTGVAADGNWTCTATHDQITVAGVILFAQVTAANTVTVTMFNKTGGNYDLASGTLRVIARRQG